MAFKHITSRDNPVFKQLKRVADSARERSKTQLTLLDGVHLIQAYLECCGELQLLIVPEGLSSPEATQLLQQLQDVDTLMFTTMMFAELTPVASSTGVLALVPIQQLPLADNIAFGLLLEDIQDPGNLGSILRTAAAAGAQAVYLSKGCTDAWSPKALRGGQGAQFVLPMLENADLKAMLARFSGVSYATVLAGESLYAQQFTEPTLFVVGNEGVGLSLSVLNAVNKHLTIPMAHSGNMAVESLNVAAATAICCFEYRRQQLAAGSK